MSRSFLRAHAPIFLILFVGAFLRWYQLAHKSLWVDEIGQVVIAQGGLLNALLAPRIHVGAPPLDYVFTWLATQGGTNEFILRFLPTFWSILTLAMTYTLARRATHSTRVANLAALLLAFSASAVQYAQEVRFYALGTLLLTTSIYFFVRAFEMPTRRNWLVFTIALTLAFYAHYYAIVLAGLLIFFMLIVSFAKFSSKNLRAQWLGLLISLGVFALLVAPWLLYAGRGAQAARGFDLPNLADVLLKSVFGAPNPATLWSWLLGILFLGAAGIGVWSLWRARSVWGILFFLFVVEGILGAVLANYFADNPFAPRQLVFFAPCYFILIACGVITMWQALEKFQVVRVAGALAVALLTISIWFTSLRAYYNVPKDDWRSAAFVISRAMQPNDVLRFTQPTLPTYLNYYAPLLAAYSNNTAHENNARRMWIVGWGARSRAHAQELIPQNWNAVALNGEKDLQVLYAGDLPEAELWNEAGGFELTPQVLAYSDVLNQLASLDNVTRARVVTRARDALSNSASFLLDSQRALLEEKLARSAK